MQRTFVSAAEELGIRHTVKDRVTALMCPSGTPYVLTGTRVSPLRHGDIHHTVGLFFFDTLLRYIHVI